MGEKHQSILRRGNRPTDGPCGGQASGTCTQAGPAPASLSHRERIESACEGGRGAGEAGRWDTEGSSASCGGHVGRAACITGPTHSSHQRSGQASKLPLTHDVMEACRKGQVAEGGGGLVKGRAVLGGSLRRLQHRGGSVSIKAGLGHVLWVAVPAWGASAVRLMRGRGGCAVCAGPEGGRAAASGRRARPPEARLGECTCRHLRGMEPHGAPKTSPNRHLTCRRAPPACAPALSPPEVGWAVASGAQSADAASLARGSRCWRAQSARCCRCASENQT